MRCLRDYSFTGEEDPERLGMLGKESAGKERRRKRDPEKEWGEMAGRE
jgi:hypothetical protein